MSATRIKYRNRELLQLIHEHLTMTGLHVAAGALVQEGNIFAPQVISRPNLCNLPRRCNFGDSTTTSRLTNQRAVSKHTPTNQPQAKTFGATSLPVTTPNRPRLSIPLTLTSGKHAHATPFSLRLPHATLVNLKMACHVAVKQSTQKNKQKPSPQSPMRVRCVNMGPYKQSVSLFVKMPFVIIAYVSCVSRFKGFH